MAPVDRQTLIVRARNELSTLIDWALIAGATLTDAGCDEQSAQLQVIAEAARTMSGQLAAMVP